MIVGRAEFVPATDEVRVVHARPFADFDPDGVPGACAGGSSTGPPGTRAEQVALERGAPLTARPLGFAVPSARPGFRA